MEQMPPNESLPVLTDANARTGLSLVGCSDGDTRALGVHGHGALNDNGERLSSSATNCKIALTNTFFITRTCGILYVQREQPEGDRKRTDCILIRQAHRP